MMAVCHSCHLRRSVEKVTMTCAPCRRNLQAVADKYFDGDVFLPLRVALQEIRKKESK